MLRDRAAAAGEGDRKPDPSRSKPLHPPNPDSEALKEDTGRNRLADSSSYSFRPC